METIHTQLLRHEEEDSRVGLQAETNGQAIQQAEEAADALDVQLEEVERRFNE